MTNFSPTLNRTADQQFADSLDCDLYRILSRAAAKGGTWNEVAEALAKVRPLIRCKMHPSDRAETQ